jgi:hypothetical protein
VEKSSSGLLVLFTVPADQVIDLPSASLSTPFQPLALSSRSGAADPPVGVEVGDLAHP